MEKDYKTRELLRRTVEEELKYIHVGQKIHLDKEKLEMLLFEEVIFEDNKKGKIPVWTGEFLRKIDLSEVSFYGVCWDYEGKGNGSEYDEYCAKTRNVDFSYTNANIDLSQAFEVVEYPGINEEVWVYYCNFEGIDLSKNDLKDITICFYYSNLFGTKLDLKNTKNKGYISTSGCNLAGLDLSWMVVDLKEFTDAESYFTISNANFTNTGLKIVGEASELEGPNLEELESAKMEGRLNGCYLNGNLILEEPGIRQAEELKNSIRRQRR